MPVSFGLKYRTILWIRATAPGATLVSVDLPKGEFGGAYLALGKLFLDHWGRAMEFSGSV